MSKYKAQQIIGKKLTDAVKEQQKATSTLPKAGTSSDIKSVRKRRIASIFQHYYPEGGWGIIVLICGFFVQLISHGFQQVFGILMVNISIRFHISETEKLGKMILRYLC